MKIKKVKGQPNDPRSNVIITVSDGVTLRVAGYDMLPHRMKPNGNYDRIPWEDFQKLLLGLET